MARDRREPRLKSLIGKKVVAKPIPSMLADDTPDKVVGIYESWYVPTLKYWQHAVGGYPVDPKTIRPVKEKP